MMEDFGNSSEEDSQDLLVLDTIADYCWLSVVEL